MSPSTPVSGSVVINEIAWMGTEVSSTDEWIELYNTTSAAIDLTGWKILIAGDKAITLTGTIDAGGYYLLERTDDAVISDVAADYPGPFNPGPFGQYGFNDNGEHLTLVDASGASIDDVDASGGWPAGVKEKDAKASMERRGATWATNDGTLTIGHDASGTPIRGTPRGANSGQ